ncbi:probable polygalacturonase At1g80170 [Asparagus officinalis]|uniref:probable polygalacturonase At1g80170 n=1 Tax=Asparagus officinalis TaxID=4686 RepID=UPI00098E559B|nr:probable polygalacturonase At1g80170 [Asparagus officinalis]
MLIFGLATSLEVGIAGAGPPPVFNVLNFGAKGDGFADDTQAFSKAWAATCLATTGPPTMYVPKGRTFLVSPITFKGPCRFQKVLFQMEGTLIAPNDPRWWKGIDPSRWLQFQHVGTLNVFGGGIINGRGQNWWKQSCRDNPKPGCTHIAPTELVFKEIDKLIREIFFVYTCIAAKNQQYLNVHVTMQTVTMAITFEDCNDLWVRDLQSVDSPQVHMLLFNCQRATLSNLKMVAPELSPNTDGIHVQNSQHIYIQNSTMQTGDDCISIGDLVNDVHIDQIVCGPGHGISIGSLGRYGSAASVEGITVRYSNFYGTTNGVRIKTWQGGKGFVRGIRFEHCNFTKVDNPVIIDQYYCDAPGNCPPQNINAVQISNVTYANLYGSSSTPVAVSLNCSQSVPCTLMEFDTLNIFSPNNGKEVKFSAFAYAMESSGKYFHSKTRYLLAF